MIKYNPKSWFKLIFALHKSDTLRILWKELIYIGVFTLIITYIDLTYFQHQDVLKNLTSVYSIIGFVISLLLVFRTNTAYDRWWEGRKKWGQQVNESRNLAIKISTLNISAEDKKVFERMIPNFSFAMKEHLRKGVDLVALNLTEEERNTLENKVHIPAAIVQIMYTKLIQLKKTSQISEEVFLSLDKNLNSFLDVLGACERIKNTPIPYSYSIFIKKFIFIYTASLPLAFLSYFGYWSALIATFVFYVLVSMEVLAEEIEDPFGTDANDLPTDDLAIKIKANVQEIFD